MEPNNDPPWQISMEWMFRLSCRCSCCWWCCRWRCCWCCRCRMFVVIASAVLYGFLVVLCCSLSLGKETFVSWAAQMLCYVCVALGHFQVCQGEREFCETNFCCFFFSVWQGTKLLMTLLLLLFCLYFLVICLISFEVMMLQLWSSLLLWLIMLYLLLLFLLLFVILVYQRWVWFI